MSEVNEVERVVMCEAKFTPMIDAVKSNGGWTHVGDGEGNKKLIVSKGDETVVLDEVDIANLIKCLAFFDPRLC